MKKKTKGIKKASARLEESLADELARAANMEEKIESLATETLFFTVLDESNKQKLYQVRIESGDHYRDLIKEFKGLEALKEKIKERFLDAPPFQSSGVMDMAKALANQLSVEKSAMICYKNILKMFDSLGGKKKIEIKGVTMVPDRAKPVIKKLIVAEKKHATAVEEVINSFIESRDYFKTFR
jgi:hypothetical protein